MLRFLTAGESHGQGPGGRARGPARRPGGDRRGHPGRAGPSSAGLRPRSRACASSRTRSRSWPASATVARWARRWPSRSPTASGRRSGPRRCRRPRAPPPSPLTTPRPGHADLAGMQKYDFADARDVLERASARETAARVAAGAVAKVLLRAIGVEIVSHVVAMGPVRATAERRPAPADLDAVDASQVRCFDPRTEAAMVAEIKARGRPGRLARRRGRGARLRPAGRPGQPRPLGPQARRPAGPGPHEHPGGQGGRDRRRLRRGRPAGERGPRPDPLGRRRRGPTAATPPGPGASRAA